jgi:hypothetical protein
VRLSIRAEKRRKSVMSDHKSEQSDNNNSGLPLISQVRHSRRARKTPRIYEGFNISR